MLKYHGVPFFRCLKPLCDSCVTYYWDVCSGPCTMGWARSSPWMLNLSRPHLHGAILGRLVALSSWRWTKAWNRRSLAKMADPDRQAAREKASHCSSWVMKTNSEKWIWEATISNHYQDECEGLHLMLAINYCKVYEGEQAGPIRRSPSSRFSLATRGSPPSFL